MSWASLSLYFFSAIWPHWWSIVSAGGFLGLDAFLSAQWPWAKQQLDNRISEGNRRKIEVALLVCAVFYSGYAAWTDEHKKFEDEYNKVVALQVTQSKTTTQLSRKMVDDLETRIKAAGPDFVKGFSGINGISIAFTCGSGAQQFAEDFSQILEASGVRASRLVFCTANTEIEASGLYMTVPDPEHMTDTAKEFLKFIRDSLIPIAPHPIQDPELKDRPQSIGFIYVGK